MASMNHAVAAMQANNESLFYCWIHVVYTVVQPKKLIVYIVSGLNADHSRVLASTLCNQLGVIHLNKMDERFNAGLIYFDEDLKSAIDDYEVGENAIEFEDFSALTQHSILCQLP